LLMLQSLGWIAAHRFLFSELRLHLLGWPRFLAPHGRRTTLGSTGPLQKSKTHNTCLVSRPLPA
jgi:hypothetical protein